MNVLRLELFNLRKGLIIWSSILAVSIFWLMAFFPSMGSSGMNEIINAETGAFSAEMLQAFGLDQMPDFSKIEEFFAYEMQYISLAGAVYAALRGANALIGEETSGTIEYLYAQPVRRSEIFIQKLLASFIAFLSYSAVITAVSLLSAALFKRKADDLGTVFSDITRIMIGIFFSGLIFLCVGFLFSTLLKSARQVTALATGFVFGTYILGMFANAFAFKIDGIKNLVYLSPLDYFMPADMLRVGFELKFILLGSGLMAVSIAAACTIYLKEDLRS